MRVTSSRVEERITEIIASLRKREVLGKPVWAEPTTGAAQATLSLLTLIYGERSAQVSSFRARLEVGVGRNDKAADGYYFGRLAGEIESVLAATLADLRAGLIGSYQLHARGEVLGDFLGFARTVLSEKTEACDRVAAVLAAAAFEETLKQLGIAHDLDVERRDLRGVIHKLKDANVLVGGQPTILLGFVKLRDHAFHAQFDKTDRSTTESLLGMIESMILEHFS